MIASAIERDIKMPGGVVFLVCIPTLSYEHELVFGIPVKPPKKPEELATAVAGPKVDLRLKEVKTKVQTLPLDDDLENEAELVGDDDTDLDASSRKYSRARAALRSKTPIFVSMETVIIKKKKKHLLIVIIFLYDLKYFY